MKVLILTGRFGMGHVSAAEAIRQEAIVAGDNVDAVVVDMVDYLFPGISSAIYKGFEILVGKFSRLYNMLNTIVASHSDVPMKKSLLGKIQTLLDREKPDLIIATFPGCAKYIGQYKESTGSKIKMYVYVTDLTIHEEWLSEGTDLYFVGSEQAKKDMISMGIDPDIIKVSGIPVRQIFKIDEAPKMAGCRRNKEVLIMGGGLGLIPNSDKLISQLLEKGDVNITVISGNNKRLKENLRQKFPQINVVGYTKKVDFYMKMADLVITKSGGITTFEALNCNTPLVILKPFLMQEIGNAKFVEDKGIGLVAWHDKGDISQMVEDLLHNDIKMEQMRAAMKRTLAEFEPICPVSAFEKELRAS